MNLGIGLGLTNYLRVPTVALDPDAAIAALFESGEVGAWYDPSDSTTVFQDAAGTTPATVGDPVGLILDKSKGLVLGSELVTNGTFNTDTSGWSVLSSATLSFDLGRLRVDVSGAWSGAQQNVSVTVGKTYVLTADIDKGTMSALDRVYISTAAGVLSSTADSTASLRLQWTATSTTANIQLAAYASEGVGDTIYFDNVSLRELPGNHATQTTSSARPVLQSSGGLYYLGFDGVDDYIQTALFAAAEAQPNTLSFAFQQDTTTGYQSLSDSNGTGGRHIFRGNGTTYEAYAGTVADTGVSVSTAATVAVAHFNTSSSSVRFDGVATATLDVGATQSWQSLRMGASKDTSIFLNGRIYSFVGVNRTLTAGEISDLESYLADKSGVTL